jgi:hypothetical protein
MTKSQSDSTHDPHDPDATGQRDPHAPSKDVGQRDPHAPSEDVGQRDPHAPSEEVGREDPDVPPYDISPAIGHRDPH